MTTVRSMLPAGVETLRKTILTRVFFFNGHLFNGGWENAAITGSLRQCRPFDSKV